MADGQVRADFLDTLGRARARLPSAPADRRARYPYGQAVSVVSLDLAAKSYTDNGLAVVRGDQTLKCEFLDVASYLDGAPNARDLADFLDSIAKRSNASCILIDGPQAWKLADNGLEHQRVCEKALHTPGKTGEPGIVKPASWTSFVEFSIELFDALDERGWPRLPDRSMTHSKHSGFALESFPTAAWRGVGLKTLPSKAKAGPAEVQAQLDRLCRIFPVEVTREPSHDEMQALVAAIAGIAFEQGRHDFLEFVGRPPERVKRTWREGFIVGPLLPRSVKRVRRLL